MKEESTIVPDNNELDAIQLLNVLMEVKKGNFSVRMPIDRTGIAGKIADTLNELIENKQRIVKEYERVGNAVGREGQLSERVTISNAAGGWGTLVKSVNTLIADLVQPTLETARVIGAVAKGDLSQSMTIEIEGRALHGEFLRTATVVNGMIEQLSTFASEVNRVAREVGMEGKLGGQAVVKGLSGTWQNLTEYTQ